MNEDIYERCYVAVENVLAEYCRGFMDKPITPDNLPELIRRMCETHVRQQHELQELKK